MITEKYVSFETAKLLKERGFDEECRAFWKEWNGQIMLCHCSSSHVFEWCHNSMLERYYNDDSESNVAAPTLGMAIEWLEVEHGIFITVRRGIGGNGFVYTPYIFDKDSNEHKRYTGYDSRAEAEEAAIRYCVENLI